MRFFGIFILSLTFVFIQNLTCAITDSAKIVFANPEFDFGQIYETDGSILIVYHFQNTGKKPLIINRIIAPGLNIEKYNRDSILPGKRGELQFSLNPFNNPGYYAKKIEVFTNAANSPTSLTVKGIVLNGASSKVFKYSVGPVAFRQSQLNFGYLFKTNEAVHFLSLINNSDSPVKLKFENVPKYISVKPMFESLAGHQTGMLEVRYLAAGTNDWDFIIDRIKVYVLGENKTEGSITISANVREDFSQLSDEEKLKLPVAFLPVKMYDFDTVRQGEKVICNFVLKNQGTRDLIIRSVKPTCGCTAVFPEKQVVTPGDSTYIKVSFDSEGFQGPNKKGVTLITNDPVNYKQFIWLNGYVE